DRPPAARSRRRRAVQRAARMPEPQLAVRAGRLSGERVLVGRDRRVQPVARGRDPTSEGRCDGRHLARWGAARSVARARARGVPRRAGGHGRKAVAGGAGVLDSSRHAARDARGAARGRGYRGASRGAAVMNAAHRSGGAAMNAAALVLAAVELEFAAAALFAPPILAQPQSKTPPPSPPTTSTTSTNAPAGHVHVYGQVYVGDRAPDFTLDGSDGKIVRPSRFRGDWVVIVFADRKEKVQPLTTVYR